MSLGQSIERVLRVGAELGFRVQVPVMASTIPWPPLVPGSQAAITASELESKSSISIGLPDIKTLTKGIFLSCSFRVAKTSESNLAKVVLRVLNCDPGAYGFCVGLYLHPGLSSNLQYGILTSPSPSAQGNSPKVPIMRVFLELRSLRLVLRSVMNWVLSFQMVSQLLMLVQLGQMSSKLLVDCRDLMASRMEEALDLVLSAPVQNSLPSTPCQRTDQPPHCMPMLSKFRKSWMRVNLLMLWIFSPRSTTYLMELSSPLAGSTPLFFSSTKDSRTAVKLS